MMGRYLKALRRFGKDESGSVIMLEFVIMVPLIFSTFLMSVELGIYSVRHMFLDRGMDITVRYVRLNSDDPNITHQFLKDMICDNSGFLEDCGTTLKLEMKKVDPRSFSALDPEVQCIDLSQPPEPDQGLNLGQEHELMLLRSCVKFRPVFPTTGLGKALEKDGTGRVRMTSIAAYVLEPT